MPYCALEDIVGDDGISGLEITDLSSVIVNNAISDAESEINRLCSNPVEIDFEKIIADGMTEIFYLEFRNGVSSIDRVSFNRIVSLQPYPEDGSWAENNKDSWGSTNITLSDESTILKDKNYSIKGVVVSGTGIAKYPSSGNLRVIYDGYTYFCFWIYADTTALTFTLTLNKDASNYLSKTFTVPQMNTWVFVGIPINDMTETGDIGNTDRAIGRELNYFEFSVTGAITYYIDGICLADKYVPVLDTGQLVWPDTDTRPSKDSVFEVSYKIDQFDIVPEDVKWACAHLAAATCWGYYAGKRHRLTGGVFRLDTATGKTERFFSFETIIRRHRKLGLEKIAHYRQGPEVLWTLDDEDEYR